MRNMLEKKKKKENIKRLECTELRPTSPCGSQGFVLPWQRLNAQTTYFVSACRKQKKKQNIHSEVRAILSRFNDAPLQPEGFFLHSPRFHLSPVVVVWQAPPTGMRPHQSPSRPVFTSSLWLPCSRAG